MRKWILWGMLLCGLVPDMKAQTVQDDELREAVRVYFSEYHVDGYAPSSSMRADSVQVDDDGSTVRVFANEAFCSQPFTPERVRRIYDELSRHLPPAYAGYKPIVLGRDGVKIEELVPNLYRDGDEDESRLWGGTDYRGRAWVENVSRPFRVTNGLSGRHLSVVPSHGRYYKYGAWRWQRPQLFCTTEDLLTHSFVFPFLIPMLEQAGAVVYSPRERDPQTAEAVVDNDAPGAQGRYAETAQPGREWLSLGDSSGFAPSAGLLTDSVQPFRLGTARKVEATTREVPSATAMWTPRLPRAGRYAVYVSYASLPNSVSDARYTVCHKGGRTELCVNQRMGGGTWVYLGTFYFDEGEGGSVVLSNKSGEKGVVTADGVRFGGGVGQYERAEAGTSGLPRLLEGARYHARWCGLPDSLCFIGDGTNDYNDDIRSRSALTNYLAGGSAFLPATEGRGVPIELSLSLHSDAGVRQGGIYGSLGICTTRDGEGRTDYPSGLSRRASSDLAGVLLTQITDDLSRTLGQTWTRRELWDRNYGESRTPDVPSAIIEMLSHQNYADMRLAHDPVFKFLMARAVYKGVLRFVGHMHGTDDVVVQPLPVRGFSAQLLPDGKRVRLSWRPVTDSLETGARPTGYVVYTGTDGGGFDNGRLFTENVVELPIEAGRQYNFRVTAVNSGGESFPSETLSVFKAPSERGRVLVVNGFERLGGPARVETPDSLGFDLRRDIGVPYLYTASFAGEQTGFDPSMAGREGPGALGYGGTELAGRIIAGNTFDYPVLHGEAIAAAGGYSFSSCSREAFAAGDVRLDEYRVIDYIAGLERDVPHNLLPYKSFPPAVRERLAGYLASGGRLFASGAYIGSDMQEAGERRFVEEVLKYRFGGTDELPRADLRETRADSINGLNLRIPVQRTFSSERYAVPVADVLLPADAAAFPAFAYSSGRSAGIAYPGRDYRVIATGFPFECITDADVRRPAMRAILQFLMQ